jgi:hypothetical protein
MDEMRKSMPENEDETTVDDLYWIERDVELIERGLKLQEKYNLIASEQEAEREVLEEAARERGETLEITLTDEERAWNEYTDRLTAGLALHHRELLKVFGLNPSKSSLYDEFPDILDSACNPEFPVLYSPSIRRFSLIETWGPAVRIIKYCPWSGKRLPKDLDDEWEKIVPETLGNEDWTYDEAREKLPNEFHTEEWWVKHGL